MTNMTNKTDTLHWLGEPPDAELLALRAEIEHLKTALSEALSAHGNAEYAGEPQRRKADAWDRLKAWTRSAESERVTLLRLTEKMAELEGDNG